MIKDKEVFLLVVGIYVNVQRFVFCGLSLEFCYIWRMKKERLDLFLERLLLVGILIELYLLILYFKFLQGDKILEGQEVCNYKEEYEYFCEQ